MSRFSKQSARRLRIEQLEDRALLSSYTFTKIADTGDQFTDFSRAPALNNSGAVAFLARPNAGRGNACLYTGDGGALTTIACEDALNANLGMFPSINDNGSVAIVLSHGMDQRVVTGAGGPLTTLYASQEYGFYSFSAPSLNRSGVVAFWVSTAILSRPEEVAAGDGGVPAIIDHSESFGFTHFGSFPALNNGGIVAYHYLFRTPDLSVDAIKTGDSETTATLYSNQEGFFSSFGDPAFNDKGSAAYFAVLARGGSGIFAGNGGPVNIIATTGKNFKSFATAPAESNRDGVAFSAELTAGGSGIFTGPDPVMDKVVATGDEVSGAQVTELHFFREGLNDNGQLAFFAALADGTSGVYRADPDGGAPGQSRDATRAIVPVIFLNTGFGPVFKLFRDAAGAQQPGLTIPSIQSGAAAFTEPVSPTTSMQRDFADYQRFGLAATTPQEEAPSQLQAPELARLVANGSFFFA